MHRVHVNREKDDMRSMSSVPSSVLSDGELFGKPFEMWQAKFTGVFGLERTKRISEALPRMDNGEILVGAARSGQQLGTGASG